jgi:2-polyprenyl-6-methoxyphenol hydroxylase-like FAD-dependent oxidoreductase
MTQDPGQNALIVGCGVAGPVLGMFLRRIGVTPVIFESRPEPRDEAGFFLNVTANGMDVLDELGVLEQVLEAGHPTDRLVFVNHDRK